MGTHSFSLFLFAITLRFKLRLSPVCLFVSGCRKISATWQRSRSAFSLLSFFGLFNFSWRVQLLGSLASRQLVRIRGERQRKLPAINTKRKGAFVTRTAAPMRQLFRGPAFFDALNRAIASLLTLMSFFRVHVLPTTTGLTGGAVPCLGNFTQSWPVGSRSCLLSPQYLPIDSLSLAMLEHLKKNERKSETDEAPERAKRFSTIPFPSGCSKNEWSERKEKKAMLVYNVNPRVWECKEPPKRSSIGKRLSFNASSFLGGGKHAKTGLQGFLVKFFVASFSDHLLKSGSQPWISVSEWFWTVLRGHRILPANFSTRISVSKASDFVFHYDTSHSTVIFANERFPVLSDKGLAGVNAEDQWPRPTNFVSTFRSRWRLGKSKGIWPNKVTLPSAAVAIFFPPQHGRFLPICSVSSWRERWCLCCIVTVTRKQGKKTRTSNNCVRSSSMAWLVLCSRSFACRSSLPRCPATCSCCLQWWSCCNTVASPSHSALMMAASSSSTTTPISSRPGAGR